MSSRLDVGVEYCLRELSSCLAEMRGLSGDGPNGFCGSEIFGFGSGFGSGSAAFGLLNR